MWGEKCEKKKHPKKQTKFVIVWGWEILNLGGLGGGGIISPLNALNKEN